MSKLCSNDFQLSLDHAFLTLRTPAAPKGKLIGMRIYFELIQALFENVPQLSTSLIQTLFVDIGALRIEKLILKV